MLDQSIEVFKTETKEMLADLEAALLDLETEPGEMELVNRAFRAMHTIKGSGSMFGYIEMSRFTHHLEDTFDRIRKGDLAISQEIIDLGLKARDHLEHLLTQDKAKVDDTTDQLLKELGNIAELRFASKPKNPTNEPLREATYSIKIKPNLEAFENGTDPLPILRELSDLGDCELTAITSAFPENPEAFNPEHLYLNWTAVLTTESPKSLIEGVFIFVLDDWEIDIEEVALCHTQGVDPIGKLLQKHADIPEETVEEVLAKRHRVGEFLQAEGLVTDEQLQAALKEQEVQRKSLEKMNARSEAQTIKINTDKLDRLMDMVGELVITQARLQQLSSALAHPDLELVAESFERLACDLRDATLDIRMLPLGSSFARFRRLVRDTSSELGKHVSLVTHGEETELDKTLIEKLVDPLVHLLRNSLDHGIETPEERLAAGKPEKGVIELSASHHESSVLIQVKDDGRGVDTKKVLAKALEKGLISHPEAIPENSVCDLIFEPGFSTADSVTNLSGRGVGMDAVKTAVESMGGSISMKSEFGQGSCVEIELPLTLAIIDGLLVRVGKEHFVLPLSSVEECIEVEANQFGDTLSALLEVRGQPVPQVCLRRWFQVTEVVPEIQQTVIVRYQGRRVGLIVDEVIGEHQTVIKSLGPAFKEVKGISGATILGTGGIALIVDVVSLTDAVEHSAKNLTLH